MTIFVLVCFVGALLGILVNALVLSTTSSWPRETRKNMGHYVVALIEQVAIAAWAAYLLWAYMK